MDSSLALVVVVVLAAFLGFGAIVLIFRRSRAVRAPGVEDLGPLLDRTDQTPQLLVGSYLETHDASGVLRTFPLTQPNSLIGRAEHADIRVDESFAKWRTVSREHARIECRGNRAIVQDNNSLNGVKVNGRRTGRNLLKHGWNLEIGGVAFTYRSGGEDDSP